jgi:hypothetical protein
MNEKLMIKDIAVKRTKKFSFRYKSNLIGTVPLKVIDSNKYAENHPTEENQLTDENVVHEEMKADNKTALDHEIDKLEDGDWDIISS